MCFCMILNIMSSIANEKGESDDLTDDQNLTLSVENKWIDNDQNKTKMAKVQNFSKNLTDDENLDGDKWMNKEIRNKKKVNVTIGGGHISVDVDIKIKKRNAIIIGVVGLLFVIGVIGLCCWIRHFRKKRR